MFYSWKLINQCDETCAIFRKRETWARGQVDGFKGRGNGSHGVSKESMTLADGPMADDRGPEGPSDGKAENDCRFNYL